MLQKVGIATFSIFAGLAGLLFANPVLFRPVLADSAFPETSIIVTICGNGVVEPGESCDDGENNRAYVNGGRRYCNLDCSGWAPSCGDEIVSPEFGEICDGNQNSCEINGYNGFQECNAACGAWLECASNSFCGDNNTNGPEICDGNTVGCLDGAYNGYKSCLTSCAGYASCVTSESCGDNTVNGNEICDGNSQTCSANGYSGAQSCNATCSGWGNCTVFEFCGDGIVNGGEQCDGGANCNSNCQIRSGGVVGGDRGVGAMNFNKTRVVIQGKAYPESSITILKDGRIATVVKADSHANFKAEIANLAPGLWTFGLWSQDKFGNRSATFSFSINVSAGITTNINGIFLPPTINLDKTRVRKGEAITFTGQTLPDGKVDVLINSDDPGITRRVTADASGIWQLNFNTGSIKDGSYAAKAKSTSREGAVSGYSNSRSFFLGDIFSACQKKADINGDNRVNLIDISILLYNWNASLNAKADVNCDGKASLVDFSIMMYQWTG